MSHVVHDVTINFITISSVIFLSLSNRGVFLWLEAPAMNEGNVFVRNFMFFLNLIQVVSKQIL